MCGALRSTLDVRVTDRSERGLVANAASDLRIEVEERVEAALELGLDLFAGAFDHVHGDVGFVAGGQLERGVVDFSDLAFGEEPETVD
jgi:hypothetical protein